jgi:ABC-type antimicrobial peptide transport system permease subunit
VAKIGPEVDDMFKNSPQPTKTETEKSFQLGFVAMLGNVKAFILSICTAVVFAILLVSANTMAMSIRERTREVAVLKTLGFTRKTILSLFVGEAVTVALIGGILGSFWAFAPFALLGAILLTLVALLVGGSIRVSFLIFGRSFRVPLAMFALVGAALGTLLGFVAGEFVAITPPGFFGDAIKVHLMTMPVAWGVAALVGFLSAIVPAYHASRIGIVEGLRHIG